MGGHNPVACRFCGSGCTTFWYTKRSTSDGKEYPIFRCLACKGAFVFPAPTEEELSIFYRSANNSHEGALGDKDASDRFNQLLQAEIDYPNSTVDAQRIAARTKQLCNSGRVLDIGSGYGFFSNALMKAGFEVDAIEVNEAVRKIFRKLNGFEPANTIFNSDYANSNARKYDVVLLSQVLEHMPMDAKPISNIRKILKDNGLCVIAVPHFRSYVSMLQGKKDMFIVPPEHLNFFTLKGLTEAFAMEGFETILTETVSRYDFGRLRRRFGALSMPLTFALKIFFSISDHNKRGLFINAYFRKAAGQLAPSR